MLYIGSGSWLLMKTYFVSSSNDIQSRVVQFCEKFESDKGLIVHLKPTAYNLICVCVLS